MCVSDVMRVASFAPLRHQGVVRGGGRRRDGNRAPEPQALPRGPAPERVSRLRGVLARRLRQSPQGPMSYVTSP